MTNTLQTASFHGFADDLAVTGEHPFDDWTEDALIGDHPSYSIGRLLQRSHQVAAADQVVRPVGPAQDFANEAAAHSADPSANVVGMLLQAEVLDHSAERNFVTFKDGRSETFKRLRVCGDLGDESSEPAQVKLRLIRWGRPR